MEFRILGSIQIYDRQADARIMPSGAKQRALLGTLVVKAGQEVPADRLVDELWGDHPPANAANALQAHVARLRRLLPAVPGGNRPHHEWLVTRPNGYVLRAEGATTDAERFHRLVTESRKLTVADPGRAAQVLRSALALWRGRALEGSRRGTICSAEASRLEESRVAAQEILHDACLRAGQWERSIGELEELTAAHPLRERFYEQLMTALYRCGRQAEALGVYERVRRQLIRDLGVEPGPTLRGCMESILNHRDPGARHDTGPQWPGRGETTGTRLLRRPRRPPEPSVPGTATDAPPAREQRSDGATSVHLLRDEVARLHRRIERLSREQQDLLNRLERLTAGQAKAV
jgi:SARP family transcriptional regulator, regulator of embCAB operon